MSGADDKPYPGIAQVDDPRTSGRPICVRLVGGLGNQLFGYSAGYALAASLNVPLRLDTSWTRHGLTDHGVAIRNLDLEGQWASHGVGAQRLFFRGGVSLGQGERFIRRSRSASRLLRFHSPKGVGDDPDLLRQRTGTYLSGYFQSTRIVEVARALGMPHRPVLRVNHPWLQQVAQLADRERPIAVHIRRGDYRKVDGFGLLGAGYYGPALRLLRERGLSGPIWVFSDSTAPEVTEALGEFGPHARVMRSPAGSELEMLAMSHAAGVVIANSTFSWWGARMAERETPVVAPHPWFRDGLEIEDLLPPEWIRMPASFIDSLL